MNKQELIEKYQQIYEVSNNTDFGLDPFSRGEDAGSSRCSFEIVEDLKKLDEPQKVKVPSFIGRWIEEVKQRGCGLADALNCFASPIMAEDVKEWLDFNFSAIGCHHDHQELLARAWLDGYEVEEEPKWKIINDQKYCLTSIEAGYGNSLHWAFDSTKKKPILFDNEETALYTAYITGGTVKKV